MDSWSLMAEFLSCIILTVMMMSFYHRDRSDSVYSRLFERCLWLTAASILLNFVSVYAIAYTERVPVWCNYLVTGAYFYVTVTLCTVTAYYLFHRILEFNYEKHCMRRAKVGLAITQGAYTLITLANLFTGLLFYFDGEGRYHRGPLNLSGYLVMAVELVLLMICYGRNRSNTGPAMKQVMRMMPPMVALVAAFQLAFPEQLLNGTLSVLADLVIYISFQDYYMERDVLTRVGNRKSGISELLLRTNSRQRFQVILVGLRHFRNINQQFGRNGGDELLTQIAGELDSLIPDGRAFRSSNVEFLLLCPCLIPREGDENLRKVQELFQRGWTVGGKHCRIETRIAELTYYEEDWDANQVIEYLEYAFQLAREEKRPLVRFDGETSCRYQRREYLLQTMRRAMADQRFQVWYQPVYHKETGSFASAEALLRLNDYDNVPISPEEFLPILESEGVLEQVSWLLLDQVCRLLGSGRLPGLECISINLSMQQFMCPDLLERIESNLARCGARPEQLKLEITERVLLEDTEHARRTMERMTQHQLGFYMDDFGTGYSNLASVLELPFEVVKLDRSLLCGLPEDQRAGLLAGTLISVFHRLGQTVVAEGIETNDQARLIKGYGADRIQGFYYAKPMPEAELVALFQKQAETLACGRAPIKEAKPPVGA